MSAQIDISVVICTRNRAESLRETLDLLVAAGYDGLAVEIVVVDNGSEDHTKSVVESFAGQIPCRYYFELRKGKSYAMNRALDEGRLGAIIVFLDDDMSPAPDWWKGVAAICGRWPDCDIFTSKSYVIWPEVELPSWARRKTIYGAFFSVLDLGNDDQPFVSAKIEFPPGGDFWVRSRLLQKGYRFRDVWLTEPEFVMQLAADGYRGVYGPDAAVGHRIQPDLLDEQTLRRRAVVMGRELPHVRLNSPAVSWQAKFLAERPVLFRLFCAANLIRWCGEYILARFRRPEGVRFEKALLAIVAMNNNLESLRIAGQARKQWRQ